MGGDDAAKGGSRRRRRKAGAGGQAGAREAGGAAQRLKVCGPSSIRTLRGRLLGREVALICCGEAHEDAMDLTREGSVVEPKRGWLELPCPGGSSGVAGFPGFDPEYELKARKGLMTLRDAQSWASKVLKNEEEDDENGAILAYDDATGAGRVFSSDCERGPEHGHLPASTILCEWADLDSVARGFNRRRLDGEQVPVEEHDDLIAQRKRARLEEDGTELIDDWLIHQVTISVQGEKGDGEVLPSSPSKAKEPLLKGKSATSKGMASPPRVELILEAPVAAFEVELHVEPDVPPAPPAHECLRLMELDSDTDSDDERDPDDGTGSYIDYLRRQVNAHLPPERVHHIDPRDLGDGEDYGGEDCDKASLGPFQGLLREAGGALPVDLEIAELAALGAKDVTPPMSDSDEEGDSRSRVRRRSDSCNVANPSDREQKPPLPSWEAYFGAASELILYSPQVKADYAPFLSRCVGSPECLVRFFDALYFRTVPEALGQLRLDPETRPFSRIRSRAFKPADGGPLRRRPHDQGLVPVPAAPVDRYLKARGSIPPRTWVSGLAEKLVACGGDAVVKAAQSWFRTSVMQLLGDPKEWDLEGDYFVHWLRECHREIYDDIDTSDPEELRSLHWAQSEEHPKSRKHRYNLREIRIPGIEDAFKELAAFKPEARASSRRERVLAKFLVDGFQLRLVDLAAILRVASVVAASPPESRVVVVFYAGVDHAKSLNEFWRSQGFGHKGLPQEGLVGKDDLEDDDPRAWTLPSCLHNLCELFPVPLRPA